MMTLTLAQRMALEAVQDRSGDTAREEAMKDLLLKGAERIQALEKASLEWTKLAARTPEPQQTYLIYADYRGIRALDVAFYHGRRPDGSHWWVLGNVEIDHAAIIAWSPLHLPDPAEMPDTLAPNLEQVDVLAQAMMATRPDLAVMSLDEWICEHAAVLTEEEYDAARAILELHGERS